MLKVQMTKMLRNHTNDSKKENKLKNSSDYLKEVY
jgi:hypothetical protein